MSRRAGAGGEGSTDPPSTYLDTEADDPTETLASNPDDRAVSGIVLTTPTPTSVANDLAPAADGASNGSGSQARAPLSIEERYEAERQTAKVRHWQESPYAVGLVEASWRDELHRASLHEGNMCHDCANEEMDPGCGCTYVSGMVCSVLGAGRVGNLAVLRETTELVEEEIDEEEREEDGPRTRKVRRSKMNLVVGPYWPMLLFITYPLILGVSGWTAIQAIPGKHPLFIVIWLVCTVGLIYALFNTGCRDPGVLRRYRHPPTADWRWNDQAQTYRPRGAIYDPDCAAVIEEFDHTCPWTGTAIGKKNMAPFQAFVALVFVCLIMDILLLTNAIG